MYRYRFPAELTYIVEASVSEMVISCIDWLALTTSKRATAVPSVSSVTKLISARRRLATLGRTKVLPSATRTHVPHFYRIVCMSVRH